MIYKNTYEKMKFIPHETVEKIVNRIGALLNLPDNASIDFHDNEFVITNNKKTVMKGTVSFCLDSNKPCLIVSSVDNFVQLKSKIKEKEDEAKAKFAPFYEGYTKFSAKNSYTFKFFADCEVYIMYLISFKEIKVLNFEHSVIGDVNNYLKMFCHKAIADKIIPDVSCPIELYNNFDNFLTLKEMKDIG